MWSLFFAAFGLGLAFCAPPGVITAEALRRGIARGFRPAFLIEIGSLVGDATWAAVALTGAALLVQNRPVQILLGVVGLFFLARLAWNALQAAWRGDSPQAGAGLRNGDFVAGAALSLANPLAIGFWLGMGGVLTGLGVTNPQPIDYLVFFSGFMIACFVWCFLIAALIAWGRHLITPPLFRTINLLCGVALAFFAFQLGRQLLALFAA